MSKPNVLHVAQRLEETAAEAMRAMQLELPHRRKGRYHRLNPSHGEMLRHIRHAMRKAETYARTRQIEKAAALVLFSQGVLWSQGVISLEEINRMNGVRR